MGFNLEVPEDISEIAKILTDIRYLLKEVVLQQLLKNELEIKQLRQATWPVCQSLRETSQITDIKNKIEFLNDLDYNEGVKLINEKAKFSSRGEVKPSTSHLKQEELAKIGLK